MDIPRTLLNRILNVLKEEKSIERAYLFGSRARGDNKYNSDIDIAVEGNNVRRTIQLELQSAAGVYKVDMVFLSDELDTSFMEEFNEDAILIYDREVSVAV